MSERAAYWRGVVERQAGSGLSVAEFCVRRDVATASFYAWRRRLAREDQPRFVPVHVAEVATLSTPAEDATRPYKPALELQRPDGVLIRIFAGAERRTIADVLAALDGVPGVAHQRVAHPRDGAPT
jgi:hypothetical protein